MTLIIYPSNIDSRLSKKEGRKVSKKHAVDSPKPLEMHNALQALGEKEVRLEKEAAYPRRNWETEGRIVLERKGGKGSLMKNMAREIRRLRASS